MVRGRRGKRGGAMVRRGRGRRRGASAGDALVVLGILGLLSGMASKRPRLAPEEVCLGNIKSICAAIQMYLAENDGTLPPREVRGDAIDYFAGSPGQGERERAAGGRPRARIRFGAWPGCDLMHDANPYLRWPVVLDGYLESRAVWRCPSAEMERTATFIIGDSDWLGHLQAHEGEWGMGTEFCLMGGAWPAGWGGEVTDSLTQGRLAEAGVFVQSVGTNTEVAGERAAALPDPKWFVICADAGSQADRFFTGTLAYPDICALECGNEVCGWVDWEECTWAADCGAPMDGSFLANPKLRQARARHKGGVNIGFLDGHARWLHSERVIALSPSQGDPERGRLRGYGPRGPTSDCGFAEEHPGVPTLY